MLCVAELQTLFPCLLDSHKHVGVLCTSIFLHNVGYCSFTADAWI